MPKAVAVIRDRGNNEPYSDTNAPMTLEMTQQTSVPANPAAGEVILQVPSGGTTLTMTNPAGTITTFGGATPSANGSQWSNRLYGVVAASSRTAAAANQTLFVAVPIPSTATLTGIRYRKGTITLASSNIIVAIYNSAGTRLAQSTNVGTASGTTASAMMQLPFATGALSVTPGLYYLSIMASSTNGDWYGWAAGEYLGHAQAATQSSFVMPSSFTPTGLTSLTSATNTPMLMTY